VPVLAKHQTRKGRLWVYMRDDKPVAGRAPPAAVFFYSRDRTGEHPERHLTGYAGTLQADASAGFLRLYAADRRPGPVTEASCWAHGRRKFFELADVAAKARGQLSALAPLAVEAVKRIDAIFDVERAINGRSIDERLAARGAAPISSASTTVPRSSPYGYGDADAVAISAVVIDILLRRDPACCRILALQSTRRRATAPADQKTAGQWRPSTDGHRTPYRANCSAMPPASAFAAAMSASPPSASPVLRFARPRP
jgi:hypothetical protein